MGLTASSMLENLTAALVSKRMIVPAYWLDPGSGTAGADAAVSRRRAKSWLLLGTAEDIGSCRPDRKFYV